MQQNTIDYEVFCRLCDVITDVCVHDIDEKPNFCPMCGSEAVSICSLSDEED